MLVDMNVTYPKVVFEDVVNAFEACGGTNPPRVVHALHVEQAPWVSIADALCGPVGKVAGPMTALDYFMLLHTLRFLVLLVALNNYAVVYFLFSILIDHPFNGRGLRRRFKLFGGNERFGAPLGDDAMVPSRKKIIKP
jgi:hypothetical protein